MVPERLGQTVAMAFPRLQVGAFVLLLLGVGASPEGESYTGYSVLQVTISDAQQSAELRHLMALPGLVSDLWGLNVPGEEQRAALLVAPGRELAVESALNASGLPHSVLWPDLQQVLDEEAKKRQQIPLLRTPSGEVTFQRFMRHGEIESYLRKLASEHSDIVTLESFGQSWEKRKLLGVCVSRGGCGGGNKKAILIEAGIHAREWIAPATALHVLYQLVERTENSQLLDGLDWYILPLMNPDGYEYSHTKDRLWRKNRSKQNGSRCRGVDLNRNFDFHWNEIGASTDPCDITFSGRKAFSEPETRNFRDFVLAKNKDNRIKMYLALHSWGWYILYPWGFSDTATQAKDHKELKSIADKANKAMVAAGSRTYRIGPSGVVLYPATGASDDWMKGVAGVEKAYTVELPGGGAQGFDIEERMIEKTVKQVFEGIKVFAENAKRL